MTEDENINHRFEILKIAREIVYDEYVNMRAEDHNRWVALNDLAKFQNRIRVPYPPFVPFPTEDTILIRARAMYAFVYTKEPDILFPEPPPPIIVEPPEETIVELIEDIVEDIVEVVEEIIEEKPHNFLPGWVRRSK